MTIPACGAEALAAPWPPHTPTLLGGSSHTTRTSCENIGWVGTNVVEKHLKITSFLHGEKNGGITHLYHKPQELVLKKKSW